MTKKRILMIDGNFSNPTISKASSAKVYLEDFLSDQQNLNIRTTPGSIDVLSNRGGDVSILELATAEQIQAKLEWAQGFYDLIIIETAPIDDSNQSKEWLSFITNIVAVFEHGKVITEEKKSYITYLSETGNFCGWIFNKMPSK
jgi:succinoglycan biosynthesis transport protein ExoP